MPDGIFFFDLSGIRLWLIKNFLRNLRKGVDKHKNIVYNVGTKEMEVNQMKWINNGIEYKRGNHQFLI